MKCNPGESSYNQKYYTAILLQDSVPAALHDDGGGDVQGQELPLAAAVDQPEGRQEDATPGMQFLCTMKFLFGRA